MGGSQNGITTINASNFSDNYPPYANDAATWSKGNDLYFYGGNGLGKLGANLYTGLNESVNN